MEREMWWGDSMIELHIELVVDDEIIPIDIIEVTA